MSCTSMTACPSETCIPAHGDFRLLGSMTVNIGPGAITPDSDVTMTVPRAASIIILYHFIQVLFPSVILEEPRFPFPGLSGIRQDKSFLVSLLLLPYTVAKGGIKCLSIYPK